MTTIEGYEFASEEVVLDHTYFVDCTFKNCTLVYHGTGDTDSEGCTVIDCEIELRGPAENGVKYLRSVVAGGGKGVVIEIIQQIFQESSLMVFQPEDESEEHRYLLDLGPVPEEELGEVLESRFEEPDAEASDQ